MRDFANIQLPPRDPKNLNLRGVQFLLGDISDCVNIAFAEKEKNNAKYLYLIDDVLDQIGNLSSILKDHLDANEYTLSGYMSQINKDA